MPPDIDDEDLTGLDRGDEVANDDSTELTQEEKDQQARDDAGRFKRKDEEVAEDEPEDEAEVEAEDEDDDKDNQNFPIRLNKAKQQRDVATARAEAAEARLAELEKRQAAPEKKAEDPIAKINEELDALYEEVEELRADGNSKEAAKIQRQIDEKNRQISTYEASKIASRTTTQAQLNARYDAMVDVLEAKFDALNPQSDDYDKTTVRELEFQVEAYEKMGMTSPAALQRAVKLIFREDPFSPAKAAKAEEKKAEPAKPADKKTDVKKAIDTQKKQAPDMSGRGVNKDETAISVAELSEEDYDKLPESKKRELRGDFVS